MAGLASLASRVGSFVSDKKSQAFLIALNDQGEPWSASVFQYFPESFSDTKTVNWQAKDIPGASLPLYQWTSSGERSISFTAQFSTDIDPWANDTAEVARATEGVYASEFKDRLKRNGVERRNVDVRSAIIWLRQYMLPTYDTQRGMTIPPPKLILYLPRSGIGLAGGEVGNIDSPDQVLCVMTQCEVTWEKFFKTGNAKLASVSLAFAQVPQKGSSVSLPQAGPKMLSALKDGGDGFLGYTYAFQSFASNSSIFKKK